MDGLSWSAGWSRPKNARSGGPSISAKAVGGVVIAAAIGVGLYMNKEQVSAAAQDLVAKLRRT